MDNIYAILRKILKNQRPDASLKGPWAQCGHEVKWSHVNTVKHHGIPSPQAAQEGGLLTHMLSPLRSHVCALQTTCSSWMCWCVGKGHGFTRFAMNETGTQVTKRGTLRLRSQEISQQDYRHFLKSCGFSLTVSTQIWMPGRDLSLKCAETFCPLFPHKWEREKTFSWHW